MLNLRIVLAILIALTYFLVVPAGSLMRLGFGGDAMTLRVSAGTPVLWLTAVVTVLIAWGIWKRFAWAWWLGAAAALAQLVRMGLWLAQHNGFARMPADHILLTAGLLGGFLLVLLTPGMRAACRR